MTDVLVGLCVSLDLKSSNIQKKSFVRSIFREKALPKCKGCCCCSTWLKTAIKLQCNSTENTEARSHIIYCMLNHLKYKNVEIGIRFLTCSCIVWVSNYNFVSIECLYLMGLTHYLLKSFMQKYVTYCDCLSGGFSRKQLNSWMALNNLWRQPCMALLTLWPWSSCITDAL